MTRRDEFDDIFPSSIALPLFDIRLHVRAHNICCPFDHKTIFHSILLVCFFFCCASYSFVSFVLALVISICSYIWLDWMDVEDFHGKHFKDLFLLLFQQSDE